MPDLYIYNGGRQAFDTALSIFDIALQSNVVVQPGSQALIHVSDQRTFDAIVAQMESYGAVSHAKLKNPAGFAGIVHHVSPVKISGTVAPVIEAPIVAPAKGK